jgi:hypothetical protein
MEVMSNLTESEASEKAGLKHIGGAYYSKTGKVPATHRTKDGELVKVGGGKAKTSDKPTTDKKTERTKKERENADNREKVDLEANYNKKDDLSKEEQMEIHKDLSGEPTSLKSIKEAHQKIMKKREQGDGGAGGPIASEGEAKFTKASNERTQKDKEGKTKHDKFVEDNKKKIQETSQQFKDGKVDDKKRPNKADRNTLKQLGFEEPYSDEALNYLATREVWAQNELEKIKKDKNSVFYKKGKKGFADAKVGDKKDPEGAYLEWMRVAYDGSTSTQAHLEASRLDTSKDHIVTQATPAGDKAIEAALQSKYEEHKKKCGTGTKESCKKADHYAHQLSNWDKFKAYHDTYAIGVDKDGNMVYIPISNKKGSHMKDPQNNTTPAQRMAFIKKQFGPEISKNVADAMDKGMDDVSRAKETTITDTANLPITKEVIKVFKSDKFTKYREDLDEQATSVNKYGNKKPFGLWLDSQKPPVEWDKLSSTQKLELMQKCSKEKLYKDGKSRIKYNEDGTMEYLTDDEKWKKIRGLGSIGLRYNTFGKLGIKFGEFEASKDAIELKEKESAVVKKAHKEVTEALFKEDEPENGYHPTERPNADNGKNVQGYISGVLKAVHADTYIDMEDDEDYDVLLQMGINGVRPSHIRECLSELSGFKGDINASGGREALKKHLREKCRIKPGEDRVSVMDSDDKEYELFNDQWRTAGAGQQKVATHFGEGIIDCMTEKVKKK